MYYEFRGDLVRGWVPRLNRFLYFVSFEEFIEYLKEEENEKDKFKENIQRNNGNKGRG